MVSKTKGLDGGCASADYLHLYDGNAALLTKSLEVIQRTAALILSAIETEQVQAEATFMTEGTGTDASLAEVAYTTTFMRTQRGA